MLRGLCCVRLSGLRTMFGMLVGIAECSWIVDMRSVRSKLLGRIK
jgi:hypothetical protein